MKTRLLPFFTALFAVAICTAPTGIWAQAGRGGPPRLVSPEVASNGDVTFRIRASKAQSVRLESSDISNLGQRAQMTKNSNEVWELTLPVKPGAWRYNFNVDGVTVDDPANPATSESNEYIRSLLYVPGADFMDTKDVPHGAVAQVAYYSSTLQRFRRLHVYTPPGYESGKGRFPVFYLLHGAMDCDNAWSTVGRAGVILDNLIAAGKAKPMVVVMPAGHTGPNRMGGSFGGDFENDFLKDIMPFVEKRYRIKTERGSRALAGLSMGGAQTLNIAMMRLDQFAYLGVFSSGVFGITGGRGGMNMPDFEPRNLATLDNPALKKGLKLFWFATGKEDSLITTTRATVDMLKKHNFNVTFKETDGAHTWINWREYLNEFAPQLFQ